MTCSHFLAQVNESNWIAWRCFWRSLPVRVFLANPENAQINGTSQFEKCQHFLSDILTGITRSRDLSSRSTSTRKANRSQQLTIKIKLPYKELNPNILSAHRWSETRRRFISCLHLPVDPYLSLCPPFFFYQKILIPAFCNYEVPHHCWRLECVINKNWKVTGPKSGVSNTDVPHEYEACIVNEMVPRCSIEFDWNSKSSTPERLQSRQFLGRNMLLKSRWSW